MFPSSLEDITLETSLAKYRLGFRGIVQGVGFRPLVARAAAKFGISGWVENNLQGVLIELNTSEEEARRFQNYILKNLPEQASVSKSTLELVSEAAVSDIDFEIRESNERGVSDATITPDFGMCKACQDEIVDPDNRRFYYPFTTCTDCGPRYSIVEKLPFDRLNTSMHDFDMCPDCEAEYQDSNSRRFYSQTNSCAVCGVKMQLFDAKQKLVSDAQIKVLEQCVTVLRMGKILAVKNTGGYLLLCDATKAETVNKLRERKHRITKPFAVLFKDEMALKENLDINDTELIALKQPLKPIVVCSQKANSGLAGNVNPRINSIGAMLPSSPLLELIARMFVKPLVATSGNISHNPIIFTDKKALSDLTHLADYVLTNNREITLPNDDSVIRFSKKFNKRIVLRRSRGFEPALISKSNGNGRLLGMGATAKATFSIKTEALDYVSTYLGNLESFETQENYRLVLNKFLELFSKNNQPVDAIIIDKNPAYFSSNLGHEFSNKWKVETHEIQHHEAHFAAVLAENELLGSDEEVLGVIWDGTGLGSDKQIWGGEFFVFEQNKIRRATNFEYFDHFLGDKMAKEPRISALSLSKNNPTICKSKFTDTEWKLYQKMLSKSTLSTSSIGRLFDGVASLLGLIDKQSFEGEAAILLEELAQGYFDQNSFDFGQSYLDENEPLCTSKLIENIVTDITQERSQAYIAAKFHFSLIKSIDYIAKSSGINRIAFSGGVFQNALLVDLAFEHLPYQLYFHKELSPNDESISYGQIYHPSIEKLCV